MTSTAVQEVSTEAAIQQAITALIKKNNAEFQQLLGDYLPKTKRSIAKKEPNEAALQNDSIVQKEQKEATRQNGSPVSKSRIPYSEMPFWKANPDLKPRVPEGKGITLEAIKELQAFFQEPGNEITDEWFDMLD